MSQAGWGVSQPEGSVDGRAAEVGGPDWDPERRRDQREEENDGRKRGRQGLVAGDEAVVDCCSRGREKECLVSTRYKYIRWYAVSYL